MDLGAYMQIADLESLAKKNEIEIPRLRGYRLMSEEKPVTEEQIQQMITAQRGWIYQHCIASMPRFHPDGSTFFYGPSTDRLEKKYLIRETRKETREDGTEYSYEAVIGFRWDRLHGKARKRLKLALKHSEKRIRAQMNAFNQYAGRADVLYIHARIGGCNWVSYGGPDLEKQTWFIERVDDYFDSTYCDIYARITIK